MLRKILIRSLAIFLLLILWMLNGCNLKPSTMGYQHRIFLFADSALYARVGDQVEAVFEKEIYTPHSEKTFYITWIPLNKLSEFKSRMNLFFLGTADSSGPVSDYLTKILPKQFKQEIADSNYFYFYNNDLFARDQVGLIMYAPTIRDFKTRFNRFKDQIYKTFEKKYYARLTKGMFEQGELKDLEKYLSTHYGWKVRLQHDYFIANQDVDKKYVWLRRLYPDRWISIWQTKGDSSLLNMNSLIAIRNRMAKTYYGGDVVVGDETYLTTVDFEGRPTKKVVGIWRNDSLLVGGPFRMYAVYDQLDSVIHFIDIAVMAPGKLKEPFLDQLEVIAHTFELTDKK